jgi:thiol-disulfide isomerase/thioredoxin
MLRRYFKSTYLWMLFLPVSLLLAQCSGVEKKVSVEGPDDNTENVDSAGTLGEQIQLVNLSGEKINLDDYKGKVIFLNFWATWCKPCIAEMPSIEKLSKELGDDGFVFLAASDEKVEKIKRFAEKYPFEFEYVQLKTNVHQLGLSVLPTTYVINKEGKIVDKVVGAREWDSSESIEIMKSL